MARVLIVDGAMSLSTARTSIDELTPEASRDPAVSRPT
jgi:hypothetical protein